MNAVSSGDMWTSKSSCTAALLNTTPNSFPGIEVKFLACFLMPLMSKITLLAELAVAIPWFYWNSGEILTPGFRCL